MTYQTYQLWADVISAGVRERTPGMRVPHLTECISWMVLESQLPHKLVYLLFDNLFDDFKLTIV